MTSRVTRSAARLQADVSGSPSSHPIAIDPQAVSKPATSSLPASSRKRKASARERSPELPDTATTASATHTESVRRRTKRTKVEEPAPPTDSLLPTATSRRKKGKAQLAMSGVGYAIAKPSL